MKPLSVIILIAAIVLPGGFALLALRKAIALRRKA